MKHTFFFLLIPLFFVAACNKDDSTETDKRGGNYLLSSTSGNLLIAGYNTGSSGFDASLTLTTTDGEVIWNKVYGTSSTDAFFAAANAPNGAFIAAGTSFIGGVYTPEIFVAGVASNGSLTWSKNITPKDSYSQCYSVCPTLDFSFLLAGYSKSGLSGDHDRLLVKIGADGKELWEKVYDEGNDAGTDTINDDVYGVVPSPDGSFYLTGNCNSSSNNSGRIYISHVASNGDLIFFKTYRKGTGFSMLILPDGKLAVAGTTNESGSNDIFLLLTNADGSNAVYKTFPMSGFDHVARIIRTVDGGFALLGTTNSKGAGYMDAYLLKTDGSGNLQWDHTYGGGNDDQGFGIVQQSDGTYFITGFSNSGGSSITLDKLSSTGDLIWDHSIFK